MQRLEYDTELNIVEEYLLVRSGDTFAVDPIHFDINRYDKNLARSTGVHKGKTREGMRIVSDTCLMFVYSDHIELASNPESQTQVEALIGFDGNKPNAAVKYDEIRIHAQSETAKQLANLRELPVVIRYQPIVKGAAVHEQTFRHDRT